MSDPAGAQSITNVAVELPTWAEIGRTLSLQAGFNTSIVVVGTLLLGVAAGIIGTFALLRKRALMGDALSHSTLPGIGLAFLVASAAGLPGRSLVVLLPGAAISGVIGVLTIQFIIRHTRLTEDTAIGAVLSVFFGAGVVILSIIQSLRSGDQGGLKTFIYGQTAAMSPADAVILGGAAVVAIGAATLLLKEFALVCFDDEFAGVQGWPVGRIDLLMMSLVVVVTVIGLQAVGIILIVALLIIPPAAARFWTDRLSTMVILSGAIGGLSGYLGSTASALLPRMPAGSVIVLTAGVIFSVSLLFAPSRGALAEALRRGRLRLRIAQDHLLRSTQEILEERPAAELTGGAVTVEELAADRGGSRPGLRALLAWLGWLGLVRRSGGAIALTDRGRLEAARVTRNHRLWEQYLVTHAEVAASHVDWSADLVEHVLSPELVAEIELSLERREGHAGRGKVALGREAP